jgi:glycerol dehydrogenase-like iron-containing ADH family enzyme
MVCPAAKILFENYASAAMEQFKAPDTLAALVGQHRQFEEARKHAEAAHEKCSIAHMALEKHWMEHSCRKGIANRS